MNNTTNNRTSKVIQPFSVLILLVLASVSANAQDLVFGWAISNEKTQNANNINDGRAIATDAQGNIYSTGLFLGTVDFDPGSGTYGLTSAGGNDIYVQKLDVDGNLVWAKRIGGSGSDIGRSIATDASGNVYVSGQFSQTVDFGSGNSTSSGGNDIFILKLDANGNFQWVRTMGASGNDDAKSIATDPSGNVYVTGQFSNTVDFGSGTGIASAGNNDIFILKLTTSGDFGWVKTYGNTGNDIGNGITADGDNVYITGQFDHGSVGVDFGSGNITSSGNDIFVLKLGVANGDFGWVKTMGGSGSDIGHAIAIDASGNVYTTGQFNSTGANFGTTTLSTIGNHDIFVQKLDPIGNTVWAKRFGGTAEDIGHSLTVDVSGNVYVTGVFRGNVDFGSGTPIVALDNTADTFVLKLSNNGNYGWTYGIEDPFTGTGFGIATDAEGSVVLTGTFARYADFKQFPGASNFRITTTQQNGRDIFVLKMKLPEATATDFASFTAVLNGNTVTLNWQTSSEKDNSHFEVEVSNDGINYTMIGTVNSKAADGDSITPLDYDFSFDVDSEGVLLGAATFSMAFVCLLFRRRNKWLSTLLILGCIGVFGTYSCSKKDPLIDHEPDPVVTENPQVFVRVKQVSKDGVFKYSDVEVIEIEKE